MNQDVHNVMEVLNIAVEEEQIDEESDGGMGRGGTKQ